MQFPMKLNYQKFALIDAKLTDCGKWNVYQVETHCFWKKKQTYLRYKLIFLDFFHGSQGFAQNTEERNVDVFFITIAIMIPAVQLLTQNMTKELQRLLWNTVEHLRWNFFAKKLHRRCLNLTSSQLVFNDKMFILD